jgi:hypothetical protein
LVTTRTQSDAGDDRARPSRDTRRQPIRERGTA